MLERFNINNDDTNPYIRIHDYLAKVEKNAVTSEARMDWGAKIRIFQKIYRGDDAKSVDKTLQHFIDAIQHLSEPEKIEAKEKYKQNLKNKAQNNEALQSEIERKIETDFYALIKEIIYQRKDNPFLDIYEYFDADKKNHAQKKEILMRVQRIIDSEKEKSIRQNKLKEYLLSEGYASKHRLHVQPPNDRQKMTFTAIDMPASGGVAPTRKHTGEFARLIRPLKHMDIDWLKNKLEEARNCEPFNPFQDIKDYLTKNSAHQKNPKHQSKQRDFDELITQLTQRNETRMKDCITSFIKNKYEKKSYHSQFRYLVKLLNDYSENALVLYFEKYRAPKYDFGPVLLKNTGAGNVFYACFNYLREEKNIYNRAKKEDIFCSVLDRIMDNQNNNENAELAVKKELQKTGYCQAGLFPPTRTGRFANYMFALSILDKTALLDQAMRFLRQIKNEPHPQTTLGGRIKDDICSKLTPVNQARRALRN